ncbi:MAG TPA: hypothetical protein VIO16_05465 [Dehalococcoidia bacterium]
MSTVAQNPFVAAPGYSSAPAAAVSTDNGLTFGDTLGGILSGVGTAANGIAGLINSTRTPKPGVVTPPVIAPAFPVNQPAGGFKLDNTTLMVGAGIGLVVLLLFLKK